MFGFLKRILGWQTVDRRKTTDAFYEFKRHYQAVDKRTGAWQSDSNFFLRYILQTKKSPFTGDRNLDEARKVLKENGINQKII